MNGHSENCPCDSCREARRSGADAKAADTGTANGITINVTMPASPIAFEEIMLSVFEGFLADPRRPRMPF